MVKLALALVIVFAAGAGLAVATPEQRAAARTITVVIKNRDYRVVDLPPTGETVGDLRVGHADLWNRRETRRVGSFHILCALTERGAEAQLTTCDFTFRLAGGEITTQGVNRRASLSAPLRPTWRQSSAGPAATPRRAGRLASSPRKATSAP